MGGIFSKDLEPGSEQLLEPLLVAGKGTLVVWERLDRVVTPGFSEQNLLDLVDNVERHLAMVFHRYLGGERKSASDLDQLPAHRAVGPVPQEPFRHVVFTGSHDLHAEWDR